MSSSNDIISDYTISKKTKNNGLFMCYFKYELNQENGVYFQQEFHRSHRKIPAPESFFNKDSGPKAGSFIKREPNTGAFPFSREVSEIPKNTFFYSTPLVAASWTKLFSV